ncbi:MAG: hypothetical protein ACI30J_03455, partial [Paludibacteraceae bacterium]
PPPPSKRGGGGGKGAGEGLGIRPQRELRMKISGLFQQSKAKLIPVYPDLSGMCRELVFGNIIFEQYLPIFVDLKGFYLCLSSIIERFCI